MLLSQSGPPSHASSVVDAAAASADFFGVAAAFLLAHLRPEIPFLQDLVRTRWWG